MDIRLVPQPYRPMKQLEKDLDLALLHQREYGGTDPVLVRLHQINVQWRKDLIKFKQDNPHYKGHWRGLDRGTPKTT